jgi:WD40 repeat protein
MSSAAFGPEGRTLVSGAEDFTMKLWDVTSGECLKTLPLLWKPFHLSAYPHRPGLFATANANGTVTLFDFSKILAPDSENVRTKEPKK